MEFYEWKYQTLYPRVETCLLTLGYAVRQARNRVHAREILLEQLSKEKQVGLGASHTLRQIGLPEALRVGGYQVIDHVEDPTSSEEWAHCQQALLADTFITGVDAITRDGKLVFIDALGNRAAAALFGPRRVCVVASMSKVVPDVGTALRRARGDASELGEVQEEGAENAVLIPGSSLAIVNNCLKFPQRIQLVLVMEPLEGETR